MTLTEVSYYSRKFLPFIIIFFLVILVFFYAIKVFFLYLEASKPKKLNIDPVFGKIKKPDIISVSTSGTLEYVFDTLEGKPITATDSAKVYFLPQSPSRFGFREKIYLIAKTLGFNTEVTKHSLSGMEAVFAEDNQKLSVNITNFNFTYEYDVKKDEDLFINTNIPDSNQVETKAVDFLRTIGRYPEELAKGKTDTKFYIYNPLSNRLIPALKNSEANIAEVNFYRPDIEQYPIVSPKYLMSQNYVIMTFKDKNYKIIKAQIKFFEKSDEQIGIYPLKSADEAYDDLKAGKGLFISLPDNGKSVTIKKMFLGYLDPDIYQQYMQPAYVFLGENNFVGYVPALKDEYVGE